MRFVDEVTLTLSSGHGGAGAVSFRREAMVPRGGPDGGEGGRGGHVYFVVSPSLNSLVHFRGKKHLKAEDGRPGSGQNRTGRDGLDLRIHVPLGTQVRDKESGAVIFDLSQPGEYLFLKGGRGGKGNFFFRSSVNQAPEYAQPGEPGETRTVILELKLIADVGIIGLPNAGKSTLISRISAARPKIADYPFTTLTPNLGVVKIDDWNSFVVADIPGLIKGASRGAGLGIQFLKHVERTKFFLHLVSVWQPDGSTPERAFFDIQEELAQYDQLNADKEGFFPLSGRPQLVVLNKIDLCEEEELVRIKQRFQEIVGYEPLAISAVTGKNISQLVEELAHRVFNQDKG